MTSTETSHPSSNLWLETPLIPSPHLSALLDCDVYLKLENLQPSQSFKSRGISHFARHCRDKHGPSVHLVIASGGNAGLAAACAAKRLDLRCTVYIPEGVTQRMLDCLKKEGAEVVVAGKYYLQALKEAEKVVELDKNAVMVPAYDDPLIWEGHGSMIEEISRQLQTKPDVIFCSVGGGGLLGGVIVGCKKAGWDDVPVIALETHGSACFYHSISVNQGRWQATKDLPTGIWTSYDVQHEVRVAHVREITSKASSLGATSPSAGVVKMALYRSGGITCATVPDEMSMHASYLFAEDHKLLVELACSTTLTPAYHPLFFSRLLAPLEKGGKITPRRKKVVMIVCGGVKVSLDEMKEYEDIARNVGDWEVCCDGETWKIPA